MESNLVRITKHYVLDKKTLNIYKVILTKRGIVKSYEKCCKLIPNNSGYDVTELRCEVAIGVIEKSKIIATKLSECNKAGCM